MYKLIKLKELTSYRFFETFKWNESNCALFSRYNIIYGWNGSGKTTLCDFFKDLEIGEISEPDVRTSLLFEDTISKNNVTITHNKLNTIPYEFRVYHNSYIQDIISEVDKVKHIFAVGTGQKERIDEAKELKSKQKNEEALLKTLLEELSSLETSFEQLKSNKASEIKNAANYSASYNKNKFYVAYQGLKNPQVLTDNEYQKTLSEIRAEKKLDIIVPTYDLIRASVKDVIIPILEETPVNITINELKNDSILNRWVEEGLSIHEDKGVTTCQFCGSEIMEARFNALKFHFNESYKELSNKIDTTIKLLKVKFQQFEIAVSFLPNSGLFYNEFKNDVELLSEQIKSLATKNIEIIKEIIIILTNKKSDMINLTYVSQFEDTVNKLNFDYSAFTQLANIIDAHNNKTLKFQKSIETAQQKIENHLLSVSITEITSFENSIIQKKIIIENQKSTILTLKTKIEELDKEVRNSQIPAEAINKDITFIMGRNELVFDNKPNGYQILRKGKIAKHLSKGEENAIALIYFFNKLFDVDTNVQNTIVILDDPISSFDSNFYYNAISYIRDKTNDAGQVFIFTHKFSLFKDYSLMYKGTTNRYMIQRDNDTPTLINEDNLISQFHDEYAFLFKQVYNIANAGVSNANDLLLYPNIGRRLLEGFLTFKIPTNDTLIEKVLKLEEGGNTTAGRAMLRLLNNYSHLRVINDSSTMDDTSTILILPDILKYLLEFIKHYDNMHYSMLAQQCTTGTSCTNESGLLLIPNKRIIKLYDIPASAGTGTTMFDDDVPYEDMEVENDECSFAVKISGDSMEPDIPNGSIALVKRMEEIPHAKIGIFFYDGDTFCKKKVDTDKGTLLVSLNKKYEPIKVLEDRVLITFGEVVGIISPD